MNNPKRYTIKLVGYYAFGYETAIVEAPSQQDALRIAKELYPEADGYVIIGINE